MSELVEQTPDDFAISASESLRSRRADRRAAKRRRVRRAIDIIRPWIANEATQRWWATRHADNLRSCSCWMCSPRHRERTRKELRANEAAIAEKAID